MPKKNKSKSGLRQENVPSDDDSVFNDDASIVSNASSGSYFREEGDEDGGDFCGYNIEEKLIEAMDMASQKSSAGRVDALKKICNTFKKQLVPEFVEKRQMTFCDIIDRALKKGKDQEQIAASCLAILVCIQLGLSDSSEDVYKDLKSTFTTQMLDPARTPEARGAMARALATLCFLTCDPVDYKETMESLEKMFEPSFTEAPMHIAALSAWNLLLTNLSSGKAMNILENYIDSLSNILESTNVDLRISAGEAIIILYENALEVDEDDAYALVESVIDQMKQLATDSQKFRSKKDRKEQKSSFREMLKTIEGDQYFEKVNINNRKEVLEIESWSQKRQYDSLCKVLSGGMNYHLTENQLVRDIFQLGAPIPAITESHSSRPNKLERHAANQQAMKVRNQARGKHRDKRSAVI